MTPVKYADIHIGIDVARYGDDETIMYARVGGGVTDGIDEYIDIHNMLKFEVHGINNGSRADDSDIYDKLGDQLWGYLRDLLDTNFRRRMLGEKPTIELLEDDKLVSQLKTRKYRVLSKGVIKVEHKDKMKKRGLASPDRADALA